MSSEEQTHNPIAEEGSEKKLLKKELAKLERQKKRQEAAAASVASSVSAVTLDGEDPLAANYGNIPLNELQSKEEIAVDAWTEIKELNNQLKDQAVLIRGRDGFSGSEGTGVCCSYRKICPQIHSILAAAIRVIQIYQGDTDLQMKKLDKLQTKKCKIISHPSDDT